MKALEISALQRRGGLIGKRSNTWTAEAKLAYYSEDGPGGCRLWVGTVHKKTGYGQVLWKGKKTGAHQLSWRTAKRRTIPLGKYVLHQCDVKRCINPDHLFLGTMDVNREDMLRKGRQARGERNARATITDAQAMAIYSEMGDWNRIAGKYGVSRQIVSRIKARYSWRHIHIGVAA